MSPGDDVRPAGADSGVGSPPDKRPVRALFVVDSLGGGGAERMISNLLPALDKDWVDPSLICIRGEGELLQSVVDAGIDATILGHSRKRDAFRAVSRLSRHIARLRPDVVITQLPSPNTIGRLAAITAGGGRRIVWVHSTGNLWPGNAVRRWTDRALSRWTHAYFVVAEHQRRYLETRGGVPREKIHLIHNGIEPTLFDCRHDPGAVRQFGIEPGAPVVGIVARLVDVKDHTTFLRAARLVLADVPNTRFLVIGDGPLRNELGELADTLGIADAVYFAGARSDVSALLPGLDVLVLSSQSEGFPLAVLEGMAAGRPVVCSNVGGLSEMVDDGVSGFLVPPGDPHQLAARLIEVLQNPTLARQMGMAARRRIEENFTLNGSVAAAEQAIADVVAGRGSAAPWSAE